MTCEIKGENEMKIKKMVFGLLLTIAVFFSTGYISVNANSDTGNVLVYNDSANTETPITQESVEFSVQVRVTGKDSEESRTSLGGGYAIINVDTYESLSIFGVASNKGDETKTVNAVWMLPTAYATQNKLNVTVAGEPIVSDTSLELKYSGQAGQYLSREAFLATYQWSDLMAIQYFGELSANQTLQIEFPLSVPEIADSHLYGYGNDDTFKTDVLTYSPAMEAKGVLVRFGRQVYSKPLGEGSYVAVHSQGNGEYQLYEDEVQNLMVKVENDDIAYINNINGAGSSDVLFTGGIYSINLARITDSLKDHGYSVAANDQGLFEKYLYTTVYNQNPIITDPDGNDANLSPNDKYVEIRQVIEAHDSTVTVGENWSILDNLDAVTSPVDASDKISEVTHTGNVDTSIPGNYPITYSYLVGNTKISKTINVTVVLAPVEQFEVTYTDGTDKELIFKNQKYTVASGAETPAFVGVPTREGYTFKGWSPAVSPTVGANTIYVAQWVPVAPTTPVNPTLPSTGVATNHYGLLTVALGGLFVSLNFALDKKKKLSK